MTFRTLVAGLMALAILPCGPSRAASTLEYNVTRGGQQSVQTVNIQDGVVWIKAAAGDANTDALFEQTSSQLVLIDHRRARYTPVNEDSVNRLSAQIEDMTPLVRGLGDQIRHLDPHQRARWEKMLEGFPLEAFETARKEAGKTQLTADGKPKTIAGVRCEPAVLSAGKFTELSFCLAQPEALGLSAGDIETLRALALFVQRLAHQAHSLAAPFGLAIKRGELDKLSGIPVQLKELKARQPLSMTLARSGDTKNALQPLRIPENYQQERLRLW
jgi:hypothetical protein